MPLRPRKPLPPEFDSIPGTILSERSFLHEKPSDPHSYISVSEEELRSISGGGPLGDALDLFFSNLRLDDLFFSGGLISLSFTFVPMLLFNVVKTGFNFVVSAYDTIADLFHFSHEERDMVQYISDQQRREEEKEQAQSAPGPKPVF